VVTALAALPPAHEQRRRVDAGGYRLHVRVHEHPDPTSGPVVLVHGWGVSSSYLMPLARRLAVTRSVYVPDLPGHGSSPSPRHALDVPALAGVLLALLDALGLDRPSLVGNSMGCQVIIDLASRHPARVDRAVLVGPTLDDDARSVVRHAARLLADVPYERLGLVPVVAWDYLRMGPRLLLQELRHMLADRELDKAPDVRAPCLVVRGERDAVVPCSWAQQVADALRAGAVREVKGWGHALNFSAADELTRIVEPSRDGGGWGLGTRV
jgi:2-hydroxy-6-oxonona-2,4-dienedioate hydrolase